MLKRDLAALRAASHRELEDPTRTHASPQHSTLISTLSFIRIGGNQFTTFRRLVDAAPPPAGCRTRPQPCIEARCSSPEPDTAGLPASFEPDAGRGDTMAERDAGRRGERCRREGSSPNRNSTPTPELGTLPSRPHTDPSPHSAPHRRSRLRRRPWSVPIAGCSAHH